MAFYHTPIVLLSYFYRTYVRLLLISTVRIAQSTDTRQSMDCPIQSENLTLSIAAYECTKYRRTCRLGGRNV